MGDAGCNATRADCEENRAEYPCYMPCDTHPAPPLVIRCYWCGADCAGRFDLIHVPGRNVPVCKGSFGTRAGCPTVRALPPEAPH